MVLSYNSFELSLNFLHVPHVTGYNFNYAQHSTHIDPVPLSQHFRGRAGFSHASMQQLYKIIHDYIQGAATKHR